jgi:hypothetical protein
MSQEKEFSQLDPGGVLKSSHQFENNSLRVYSGVTSVPPNYSRVALVYTGDSITQATFFIGELAKEYEIKFHNDVLSSLNNSYFVLSAENNTTKYYVWYNVAGLGIDPAPAGLEGLEVKIEANEPAAVIALATELVLREVENFDAYRFGENIIVRNNEKGKADDLVDVGTGFVFTKTQEGTETIIKDIDIPLDPKVKVLFNTQERKFEIESATTSITIDSEVDIDHPDTGTVVIRTVTTALAEETLVLPQGTSSYTITVRKGVTAGRVAFSTGDLAAGDYKYIPRGVTWESPRIDTEPVGGRTIYFTAEKDDVIMEIEYWRIT